MKFDIVELKQLSGSKATIYTIKPEGIDTTLFDEFIQKFIKDYKSEVENIVARLKIIGKKHGARKSYFKSKEGSPGDFMCALYDDPNAKLRLYCIEMNGCVVILGSGAPKSKNVRAWQDEEILKVAASQTKACAKAIMLRIDDKKLTWTKDYEALKGDFNNFETEE